MPATPAAPAPTKPSVEAPQQTTSTNETATAPVIPASANSKTYPPKPETPQEDDSGDPIIVRSSSKSMKLEPRSAPHLPPRVPVIDTDQSTKPWYCKFYVRADYGRNLGAEK